MSKKAEKDQVFELLKAAKGEGRLRIDRSDGRPVLQIMPKPGEDVGEIMERIASIASSSEFPSVRQRMHAGAIYADLDERDSKWRAAITVENAIGAGILGQEPDSFLAAIPRAGPRRR